MSSFIVPTWAGLALLLICTLSHVVSADVSACSLTDAVEAEGNMALLQKASTRASTILAERQPEAPAAETESLWHKWQQSLWQTFWPNGPEEEAEKAAVAEKAALAEKAAVAEKAAILVDEAILKEVQIEHPDQKQVAERPLGNQDEVEERLVQAVEKRLEDSGVTKEEMEEIIEAKSGTPQAAAEKAVAREAAKKAAAAETAAAAEKAASESALAEKAAAEKALAEKAAAEKASAEKALAEKAAAEKAAAEKEAAEKAAAEKAAAEKAAAEKEAAEKAAAKKATVEEAAAQKAPHGKGAAGKAAAKNEADEKADVEQAENDDESDTNEGALKERGEEKVIDKKDAIEKEVGEKEAIEDAVAGAAAAAAAAAQESEPKVDAVDKKVIRMDIQNEKEKPVEAQKESQGESKGEVHDVQEEKKLAAQSAPSSEDKEKPSENKAGDEKEHASVTGLGSMASLDDVGLEDVLKLNDGIQMALFVRRAVHEAGMLISDDSGLDKFAGHSLPKGQRKDPQHDSPLNFGDLSNQISKAAIGKHSWVSVMKADVPLSEAEQAAFGVVANPVDGLGLTTPLNEGGYKAVAKLKSEAQMNVFIHRVVNHLGLTITDRWGIMGILPWYSGQEAVQSFAQLTSEILKASMLPGKWVKS